MRQGCSATWPTRSRRWRATRAALQETIARGPRCAEDGTAALRGTRPVAAAHRRRCSTTSRPTGRPRCAARCRRSTARSSRGRRRSGARRSSPRTSTLRGSARRWTRCRATPRPRPRCAPSRAIGHDAPAAAALLAPAETVCNQWTMWTTIGPGHPVRARPDRDRPARHRADRAEPQPTTTSRRWAPTSSRPAAARVRPDEVRQDLHADVFLTSVDGRRPRGLRGRPAAATSSRSTRSTTRRTSSTAAPSSTRAGSPTTGGGPLYKTLRPPGPRPRPRARRACPTARRSRASPAAAPPRSDREPAPAQRRSDVAVGLARARARGARLVVRVREGAAVRRPLRASRDVRRRARTSSPARRCASPASRSAR